jgi:outer membrane immunogenic protein
LHYKIDPSSEIDMQRPLLSLTTMIATTVLACAADLPQRTAPSMVVPAVPGLNWTGFYAGVHGAFLRADGEAVRTGMSNVPPNLLPARAGLGDSGFGAGAQIGYLWNFGSLVAGAEADLTVTDVGRTRSSVVLEGPFAVRTDLSSQMNLFGSLKGRLGIALPSLVPFVERSLAYVTGGVAVARIEYGGQIEVAPLGLGPEASSDAWKTGFVIGAGMEHMLTPNVSLKSETLYYNLGDETLTLTRAGAQASYRFANDGWISRVGLNLRF